MRTPYPWRSPDVGETLIEILIAIAILGISVVFIMSSLAASEHTTSFNRTQAQASAALTAGAEWVKADGWVSCSGAGYKLGNNQVPQLVNLPAGTRLAVSAPQAFPSPGGGCGSNRMEAQTVSLNVPGDTGLSDSLVVVTRQP